MKKSDLKNGMIIKNRNEDKYILIGDTFLKGGANIKLSFYSDDLFHCVHSGLDIIEVFECEDLSSLDDVFKDDKLKSIWKRESQVIDGILKIFDEECDKLFCKMTCIECRARAIYKRKDDIIALLNRN